ncbi:MAG: DUF4360 domain-containing protein [Bacteriovoracaceae bacterium]|jgi:hypothetical protein|nr:DUF4360 domain-containing protein [Bacteriovoracaceae bacterium]
MRSQIKLIFYQFIVFTIISPAYSGHRVGNGGDLIRANFIATGNQVVKFLLAQKPSFLEEMGLSEDSLQQVLDYQQLEVSELPLIDNSGSLVDALGVPGKITLNKSAWIGHFENLRDIYFLVFHEMLRSLGVDDDNYKISNALLPFPDDFKIDTRFNTDIPLDDHQKLKNILETDNVILAGPGCKKSKGRSFFDIDWNKNILRVTLKDMSAKQSARTYQRVGCYMALPIKGIAGKKLTIGMVDIYSRNTLAHNDSSKLFMSIYTVSSKPSLKITKTIKTQGPSRTLTRSPISFVSGCGETSILRSNLGLFLKNKSGNASSNVEKIEFYLSLEDC